MEQLHTIMHDAHLAKARSTKKDLLAMKAQKITSAGPPPSNRYPKNPATAILFYMYLAG